MIVLTSIAWVILRHSFWNLFLIGYLLGLWASSAWSMQIALWSPSNGMQKKLRRIQSMTETLPAQTGNISCTWWCYRKHPILQDSYVLKDKLRAEKHWMDEIQVVYDKKTNRACNILWSFSHYLGFAPGFAAWGLSFLLLPLISWCIWLVFPALSFPFLTGSAAGLLASASAAGSFAVGKSMLWPFSISCTAPARAAEGGFGWQSWRA